MKFIFDKVDLQSPEKEFSFSLKFDSDRYTRELEFHMDFVLNLYLIFHFTWLVIKRTLFLFIAVLQCSPPVEDSEELMKDLNLTNDLVKFVRIIRQRFQAAALNGTQYIFIFFVRSSIKFISILY